MNQSFITNETDAINDAAERALESQQPLHVINTHGYGYEVVTDAFDLNRTYYHGERGKKMYFTLIKTVYPLLVND